MSHPAMAQYKRFMGIESGHGFVSPSIMAVIEIPANKLQICIVHDSTQSAKLKSLDSVEFDEFFALLMARHRIPAEFLLNSIDR
jgi:hypothetical protein